MAVAKTGILKADVEAGVTILSVEYKQRVVAFVRRSGDIEPRPERVLYVAAC